MSLADQIAADVVDVFLNTDEFAEEVSYTPAGGAASTINGIVANEQSRQEQTSDGIMLIRSARLTISRAASGGIASPAVRDTVSVRSETWAVVGIAGQDANLATLDIERHQPVEKSGSGHRIQR